MTTNNGWITSSNLLTPLDIKEHAVIERWRSIEKHREEQLQKCSHRLSPAHRVTLDQQIHDKIANHNSEQRLAKAYAEDSAKHADLKCLLEIRQERDRRSLAREVNHFRLTHQRSTDAREYDLNEIPISAIERDGRSIYQQCGLGSCLFFQGEDRNKRSRERKQKEQMARWTMEQCRQKYEETNQQQMIDRIYDCNQLLQAKHGESLAARQTLLRRQINNEMQAFNRALSEQKQRQRNEKDTFEAKDRRQETENILVDPILMENRQPSISQFGPHRPLLTHWKSLISSDNRTDHL